jgi:hypothetical protein
MILSSSSLPLFPVFLLFCPFDPLGFWGYCSAIAVRLLRSRLLSLWLLLYRSGNQTSRKLKVLSKFSELRTYRNQKQCISLLRRRERERMSGALAQSCVSVLRSIRTIQPRCPSVCALQQRTSLPSRQGKSSGLLSSGETTTKQLRQQRFLTVKAVDVSGPGTVDFPLITSMQEKVCFLYHCFSSLSSSS